MVESDLGVHDRASCTQVRLENQGGPGSGGTLPVDCPLPVLLDDVLVLPPHVEVGGRHVGCVSVQYVLYVRVSLGVPGIS